MQPFGRNRYGLKIGGYPPLGEGELGPHLTQCLPVCLSCSVLSVMLVHCGQTVLRIKMKLGMQVGLSHGHIVLDGDPASPKRGTAPNFQCPLWLNSWMD